MVAKRKAKPRPNRWRYSKISGFVKPPKGASKFRVVTLKAKKKK